jgi:hypothetical protein
MKFEIENTEKKYPMIKPTDRFILKCGYAEIEINAEEYALIDEILIALSEVKLMKAPKIKLKRTQEWINLDNFNYLTRKKSNEPKIFGEDIPI